MGEGRVSKCRSLHDPILNGSLVYMHNTKMFTRTFGSRINCERTSSQAKSWILLTIISFATPSTPLKDTSFIIVMPPRKKIEIKNLRDFETSQYLIITVRCIDRVSYFKSLLLGAEVLAIPLTRVINASMESGIFPGEWKEAIVTPILKKGDQTDKANYRPVSCLVAASKVLEKVVCLIIARQPSI